MYRKSWRCMWKCILFMYVAICVITYTFFIIYFVLYFGCFSGQNNCTSSDTVVHKTTRFYTCTFHSSWQSVYVILKLVSCCSATVMADVSFQTQRCHISCCSRPVTEATVAPCSAVWEDYWTGLEWCSGERLWVCAGLVVFPCWINRGPWRTFSLVWHSGASYLFEGFTIEACGHFMGW